MADWRQRRSIITVNVLPRSDSPRPAGTSPIRTRRRAPRTAGRGAPTARSARPYNAQLRRTTPAPRRPLVKPLIGLTAQLLIAPAPVWASGPAATPAARYTIAQIFARPGLTGYSPEQVQCSPDGRYLTYLLRHGPRGRANLYLVSVAPGTRSILLASRQLRCRRSSQSRRSTAARGRHGRRQPALAEYSAVHSGADQRRQALSAAGLPRQDTRRLGACRPDTPVHRLGALLAASPAIGMIGARPTARRPGSGPRRRAAAR